MDESKKVRTRKKIIEAALAEFSQHGIGNTTFDNIAVGADVARRTVYYHFKDKKELLHAIIDPRLEEAIKEIEAIRKACAGFDAVADFCIRFWRFSPGLALLFIKLQEEKVKDFSGVHNVFLIEFAELLSEMSRREKFRFPKPETTLRIIFFSLFPLLQIIANEDGVEAKFRDIFQTTLLEAQ